MIGHSYFVHNFICLSMLLYIYTQSLSEILQNCSLQITGIAIREPILSVMLFHATHLCLESGSSRVMEWCSGVEASLLSGKGHFNASNIESIVGQMISSGRAVYTKFVCMKLYSACSCSSCCNIISWNERWNI